MRVFGHAMDEGGNRLVGEVAFELVSATDLAGEAAHFEFEERPQRAEDMVADRAFPAHEEATDVADLLECVVVALDLPLATAHVPEVAEGDLHALFCVGRFVRSASRCRVCPPCETASQSRPGTGAPPCPLRASLTRTPACSRTPPR